MIYIKENGVTVESDGANLLVRGRTSEYGEAQASFFSAEEAEALLRGLLRWKLEITRNDPNLCAALDDALELLEPR